MRDIARPSRRFHAAFLAWLIGFSMAALATAQIGLPRPTPVPRPTPTVSVGQLVGDDSDIEPQAIQTVAGGKPAKFDRFVSVVDDITNVPIATCVSVRLQPRADRLHPTLSSTIAPVDDANGCALGQIRTCAAAERGDCGKYTVTIDSQLATPPATYRSDLIGTCGICNPIQADVGGVRFAIAKARVDVTVAPGTDVMTVQAGGRATYAVFVQRTSYAGQIAVTTEANDPLNVFVDANPRTIPPADPNARHTVVITANTGPGTPPATYQIRVGATVAAGVMADVTTTNLTLVVTPAPAQPTLTVSINPTSLEARRSTCAQFEVTVSHANFPADFKGTATLALLPAAPTLGTGLNAFFTNPTVPIVGSVGQTTSTLRIGVAPTAVMQTYTLPVRASTTVVNQTVSDTENAALMVLAVPPRIGLTATPMSSPPLKAAGSFTFQLMLQRGRQQNCPPTPVESVELVTGVFNDFSPAFMQPGTTDAAQLQVIVAPQPTPGPRNVVISGLPADADKYEIVPTTVTVVIDDPPQPPPPPVGGNLTVTPVALAFTAVAGGPNPTAGVLSIGSSGGVLGWSASDNASWLTVSPATGATGTNANAIVNVAGLAAGTYNATITLMASGSPNVAVPVTLTLTAPPPPSANLVVSPTSLAFTAQQGGAAPAPRALSITSSGAPLNWTVTDNAAFVNATPASGTTPGATNVSINIGGLAAGSYNATITISAPGVPSRTVPVSLTITGSPPPSAGLVVSPASLAFTAPQGGPAPQPQVLSIGSSGAPLSWSVSDNATFVNETPASGATPGATNVSVNVGGLAPGSYNAVITVSATGATPVSVPVNLVVTAVGAGTPVVNGFNPVSGGPGTQIEVIGVNFVGVTQVQFNTAAASFQPSDSGRLFATVPSGATTGPIRITNASGTGASFTPFTVTSGNGPSISGFNPGSGRPGDRITIQGANFTDPAQVFFNNTPSPFVLFAGPNFLSAEVPSGATTGPIRVTTSAGSTTSAQSFVANP